MTQESKTSECSSCGAEIRWMKTRNDKNIPVDVPAFEDPNRDFILDATLYDKQTMKTHFETCPQADKHRGQAQRQETPPSADASINAKRLNIALAALESISKSAPDGIRSQNLASMTLTQIRGILK